MASAQFDSVAFSYYVMLPIFLLSMSLILVVACFRRRALFVTIGYMWTLFLISIFLFTGYYFNWFPESEDNICEGEYCYCEEYVINSTLPGLQIIQPAATFSSLAFIVAGLVILFIGSEEAKIGERAESIDQVLEGSQKASTFDKISANPIAQKHSKLSMYIGCVTIFIGYGSMTFHASMKRWGALVDAAGILIFLAFWPVYRSWRIFSPQKDGRWFVGLYLFLVITYGLLAYSFDIFYGILEPVFGTYAFLQEIFVYINYRRQKSWPGLDQKFYLLICAVSAFALAIFIWIPSGGVVDPICPHFIPHVTWHLFSSTIGVFLFLYVRSEKAITFSSDNINIHKSELMDTYSL